MSEEGRFMFDDELSEEEVRAMASETLALLEPGCTYRTSELFPGQDDYLFEIHEALLEEVEERGYAIVREAGFRGRPENTRWRFYRSPDGVSVDSLGEMESFSFSIGGFFHGSWEISLDVSDGHACKITDIDIAKPRNHKPRKVCLTDEQVRDIRNAIFEAGVLGWENRYDSLVFDGTQWSLAVFFSGGYVKKVYGSNVWPAGFDALEAALVPLGLDRRWGRC